MSKGISATIPFLLASMAIMGQPAIAEDYPLRPMTVFGTTPAGTSVDLTTRFFGERIKAATGQPWVVENKPGAGGAIAAKAAAVTAGRLHDDRRLERLACRRQVPVQGPAVRSGEGFRAGGAHVPARLRTAVNPEKTPVKSVAELTAFLKAKKGRSASDISPPACRRWPNSIFHIDRHRGVPAAYRNPAQMMNELEAGDYDFSFTSAEYSLKPSRGFARWQSLPRTAPSCCPNCRPCRRPGLPTFCRCIPGLGFSCRSGRPTWRFEDYGAAVTEIAQREESAVPEDFCRGAVPGDRLKTGRSARRKPSKHWDFS